MCGRYVLLEPHLDSLLEPSSIQVPVVESRKNPKNWKPRYNLAPFQNLPVFTLETRGTNPENSKIHLKEAFWDLIPSYTKDIKTKYKMINLKVETITDPNKPYWNRLLKAHRCLIPTTGFYEWQVIQGQKTKQPFYLYAKNKKPFFLAGLWDEWKSPEGEVIPSFTILTCPANPFVAKIHNDKKRMPVILDPTDQATWLNPKIHDVETLSKILLPYPPQKMEAYPVSTWINTAKNDDPKCIEPMTTGQTSTDSLPFNDFQQNSLSKGH